MCCKVADLEAHGGHGPSDLLKDELTQSLEELEALLKAKDEVGSSVFHFLISRYWRRGYYHVCYCYRCP